MKKRYKVLLVFFVVFILGLCVPQDLEIPVKGATKSDYHPQSFWYYPWGKSGTHKGVDIFAKSGTTINSATKGIVLFTGNLSMGGNVVVVLGPKWRLHYYAHLKSIHTSSFTYVNQTDKIGEVGDTGNAKGKAPHLHYSIMSIAPYVWEVDSSVQGWKKMFYLNPIAYF